MDFPQGGRYFPAAILQITPASGIARIAAKIIAGTRQADWDNVGGKLYRMVKFQECDVIFKEEYELGLILGVYLPDLGESVNLLVGFWREKFGFLLVIQSYP